MRIIKSLSLLAGIVALLTTVGPASSRFANPNNPCDINGLKPEGAAVCNGKSWSYQISWPQVTCNGQVVSNYSVVPLKCASHTPVACTGGKCSTSVSGCRNDWASVNVQVTALAGQGKAPTDFPPGGIKKPPSCR
jgi:hypothetical protein